MVWQTLHQEIEEAGCRRRILRAAHHVRHQHRTCRAVPEHRHRGTHAGRGQRCIHFGRFDPLATYLDLSVGTAQVLQVTTLMAADEVAGAVHPPAVCCRHETTCRQRCVALVPHCQGWPGEVQLAHCPVGCRSQVAVENLGLQPRHRGADGGRTFRTHR